MCARALYLTPPHPAESAVRCWLPPRSQDTPAVPNVRFRPLIKVVFRLAVSTPDFFGHVCDDTLPRFVVKGGLSRTAESERNP